MSLPRYVRQVVLGLFCMALLGLFTLLVLGLGLAEPARAADSNVPCDVEALVEAIHTANGTTEADSLTLAAGCTYTLTAADNDADGPNGLPAIRSEITIDGNGATIERSDVPGTAPFRIFYVAWDGGLTLNQLTVRNGDPGAADGGGIYNRGTVTLNGSTVSGNAGSAIKDLLGTVTLTDTVISGNGAGIGSYGGTVTLDSSTVSDNAGAGISVGKSELILVDCTVSNNQGTGIVGDRAAIRLTHCTVTGNQASGDGGGIASYSDRGDDLTLTDSTVSGNTADGDGGGIWIAGDVYLKLDQSTVSDNVGGGRGGGISISLSTKGRDSVLTDSTVSGNEAATRGGGIYNDGSVMALTHSTVNHNLAGDAGGGIFNNGGTSTLNHSTAMGNKAVRAGGGIMNTHSGIVILTNSRVQDNRGGGLCNDGTMTVTGSTVSGNEATQGMGGGIEHRGSKLSLVNSTISGNVASATGGGLYSESLGPISLANSTVSDNQAADGGGIYSHGPVHLLNTLVAGQLAGKDCGGPGVLTSQGHNLDSDGTCVIGGAIGDITDPDPLLGPLQDNDGPTETHALLPGSPAIDAGDDATCLDTDQRGVRRPLDDDNMDACDIGAYEAQ